MQTRNRASSPDPAQIFQRAEGFFQAQDDERAMPLYEKLLKLGPFGIAYMRMAQIYNHRKQVDRACEYHSKAFEIEPTLAQNIWPEQNPLRGYRYDKAEETFVETCPLCGSMGEPYAAHNTLLNEHFVPGFNPVRRWMYCGACVHIFANNYPRNLGAVLSSTPYPEAPNVNTPTFPYLGNIMSRLRGRTPGDRLLDVGAGAGEIAAVALEYLFEVEAIEIREAYAKVLGDMLGIRVHAADFVHFESDRSFDVISMGDVIEHLSDPRAGVERARELLSDGGVLWISTPNFESAFSRVMKERDPMWHVCEHLNYFSLRSLGRLLSACGFDVVDYRVSGRYNGSMEVTAVRLPDCRGTHASYPAPNTLNRSTLSGLNQTIPKNT